MMASLAEVDIQPYEGLVLTTARMYGDYLDDDVEDVQQILRLKIAQALVAFDPERKWARWEDRRERERRWVFGAVRNLVRDLLKQQSRLNDRRHGGQLYIADVAGEMVDDFEHVYLAEEDEEALRPVLDTIPELPSTLTALERQVVFLLVLDLNQTEIATRLRVTRTTVRLAHAAVQQKMAGWRQCAPPVPVAA